MKKVNCKVEIRKVTMSLHVFPLAMYSGIVFMQKQLSKLLFLFLFNCKSLTFFSHYKVHSNPKVSIKANI